MKQLVIAVKGYLLSNSGYETGWKLWVAAACCYLFRTRPTFCTTPRPSFGFQVWGNRCSRFMEMVVLMCGGLRWEVRSLGWSLMWHKPWPKELKKASHPRGVQGTAGLRRETDKRLRMPWPRATGEFRYSPKQGWMVHCWLWLTLCLGLNILH